MKAGPWITLTGPNALDCGEKGCDDMPWFGAEAVLKSAALIMPIDVDLYGQNAGLEVWHNVPKAKWLLSMWYNRNKNGCCNKFPAEQGALDSLIHERRDVRDLVARIPSSRWTWFAATHRDQPRRVIEHHVYRCCDAGLNKTFYPFIEGYIPGRDGRDGRDEGGQAYYKFAYQTYTMEGY